MEICFLLLSIYFYFLDFGSDILLNIEQYKDLNRNDDDFTLTDFLNRSFTKHYCEDHEYYSPISRDPLERVSFCMTTPDYVAIQFCLTTIIITLGWIVQGLVLLRIWTTPLNMNLAWKFSILIASLLLLGPAAMDLFCIFVFIFWGDFETVEQVKNIQTVALFLIPINI